MMVLAYRLDANPQQRVAYPARRGRSPKWRDTHGLFVTYGFMDVTIEVDDTFVSLARKIRKEFMGSMKYLSPSTQFAEIHQASHSALNLIVIQTADFAGMPTDLEIVSTGFSDNHKQLEIHVIDFNSTGYRILFDMAEHLFPETLHQRYVTHYQRTLQALLEDPQGKVCDFPLIDESDNHAIQRGNRSDRDGSSNKETANLYTLFEQQVRRTPDRLALKIASAHSTPSETDKNPDQAWTYAELYPHKRLDYMAKSAGLTTIISTESDSDTLQDNSLNYLLLDSDGQIQTNPPALNQSTEREQAKQDESGSPGLAQDCAYVMFTSGSTGLPKAVVATHQATINRLQWMWERFPFAATDVCCQKTALSFVDSVWEMFGPLLRGVPTVVIPQQSLTDVIEFVDILEQEHISRLVLVPTLLSLLLDTHRDLGSRLHKLTLCTVSGEPLPRDTASRFFASMPDTTLLNLYGSTEVSADVTFDIVARNALSSPMPLGGPINNTDIYLLDDSLNLLPAGCVGEICISGHAVAAGYLDETFEPDRNQESPRESVEADQRFIKNPFSNEPGFERLYRTGDLGRLREDGLLEHLGRRDSQVKLRGIRIDFAEIELALTELPEISNAVAGVNRFEQLFAAVTAADNATPDPAKISSELSLKLPAHLHIQPDSIQLLDQLPVLPNGKLDRKHLEVESVRQHQASKEQNKAVSESVYLASSDSDANATLASQALEYGMNPAQAGAPTSLTSVGNRSGSDNSNENADVLTSIWCRILGQSDIDTSKNFFQLGGNSINAMQIVVECQRAGLDLNLKDIVDYGSIDNLAPTIRPLPLTRLQATDSDQQGVETSVSLAADDLAILDSHLNQHFGLSIEDRDIDFFRLSEGQRGMLFETYVVRDLTGRSRSALVCFPVPFRSSR